MAYNFDPGAGLLASAPPGSGVLAAPQTITNPLQSPMAPGMGAGLEAANAAEKLKRSAMLQAMFKAMALREQPLYGRGAGPLGARMGEGPGGWALALGDTIAGALANRKHDEATQGVTTGMEGLVPAVNATDAAANAARRQFVPQGTPLGGFDPLGLR
jgi:hypothetical protein